MENYKTLMKETKNSINIIPCSWIRRISVVKMIPYWSHTTTQSHLQIQCNPCQIISGIFHRTSTKNLWKHKRPQSNLRKKNGAGGINLPDLRLHHQTTVIKTVIVLAQKQKYRPMEQDKKPRNKPMHIWVPYF